MSIYILIPIISFFMIIVGSMDCHDIEVSDNEYCEMVSLWNSDAQDGIPGNQRRGWPDYKKTALNCVTIK